MALFVTLSRGSRPDLARPVLATSDRTVIGAVLQSLARLDERGDDEGSGLYEIPSLMREDADDEST